MPSDALVIAPVILAVVLVVSAVGKLREPAASAEAFRDLRVPRLLSRSWMVRLLPWGELLLAVVLLVAWGPVGVVAAVAAVGLFLAYLALVARARGFETDVDCACFGSFAPGRITGLTVWRNAWLLALAVVGLALSFSGDSVLGRVADDRAPWWWLVAAAAAALTVLLVAGLGGGGGEKPTADEDLALEEEDYIRTRTPAVPITLGDGSETDLRRLSRDRPQLLLFVSPGCGGCQDTIAATPQWREQLPLLDIRYVVTTEPSASTLTATEEPMSLHDTARRLWDSFGVRGTPGALLLGIDGMLAGGPVSGGNVVSDFVDQIKEELASAVPADA